MKKQLIITIIFLLQSFPLWSEENLKNNFVDKGLFCFNQKEDEKRDVVGLWFLKDNLYETHSLRNIEDVKFIREFEIDSTIFTIYGYSVSTDKINLYIKNIEIFGTIDRYNAEYYNKRDKILRKCEFYKDRDLLLDQLSDLVEKRKTKFQNKQLERLF